MEVRFLRRLGRIAHHHRATLYYPAAGLDLSSVLATGITNAVLLDPAYLRRGRIDLRIIKRAVRTVDAEATFERRSSRVVIARMSQGTARRTITFIRGAAGRDERLARRHFRGRSVFLAKGCLVPAVLCPPGGVDALTPIAYAVHLVDLPRYSALVRAGYTDPLLDLQSPPSRMVIYRRYHASSRRAMHAERAWRELLATARAAPIRRAPRAAG